MFGSFLLLNILDFILRNSEPRNSKCYPCRDNHLTEIGRSIPTFSSLRLTIKSSALMTHQSNLQPKIPLRANHLRWPNTVCARFTDSVSDAIKRALGLW